MKQLVQFNSAELAEMQPIRQQMDQLGLRQVQLFRLAMRRCGIDPDVAGKLEPISPTDWTGINVELPDEVSGNAASSIEIPLSK